jgi:RNA polymerase sigma-70 factor (ECF subfamily)
MAAFENSDTFSNRVPSDAELVARCNAGETEAFGMLMSRHEASLRKKIRRFGMDQTLAEDLEQETWLRAYRKLGQLRTGASFKAWLMRVADTNCLGYVRDHRWHDEVAVEPETLESTADSSDPVEDLATFTGLLANIPLQHSQVLMLRYLEGLSLREIAAETGLSLSGVKWRLGSAKQSIREAMGEMDKDDQAVERLVKNAQDAAQASRWQEALETYETAARKASLDWHSLQELGRIYERRGDFHRAIKLLEQSQRMRWSPWTQVVIAWCYDGLGEREKAVEIYEWILKWGEAGQWAATTAFAGMKAPHKRQRSEPEPVPGERAIPRRGWSVKTNHNPDDAHLAIDGDLMTRWTSQAPQDHNMYFELDLGKPWPVTRVVYDDDGSGQCQWIADCPHGYVIQTSLDRVTWREVAKGGATSEEYGGAVMDGSPVRYIRMKLTRNFYPNWWGIYEMRVYAR